MPKFTATATAPTSTTRPLSWRDVDGDAPLRQVLVDFTSYMGSGWAAAAALDGRRYQLRAGGFGGPRSRAHKGEPGCYALLVGSDRVFEVLLPSIVPAPAPVDVEIDLVPIAAEELAAYGVPAPDDLRDWGVEGCG